MVRSPRKNTTKKSETSTSGAKNSTKPRGKTNHQPTLTTNNQPTLTTNNQPTLTTNHQPTSPLTPVRKKRTRKIPEKLEAGWGYDNDVDAAVWNYSTFTESGANTLAKTMKKLGCTIVERPKQREDGLWMFAFTNPLLLLERSKT